MDRKAALEGPHLYLPAWSQVLRGTEGVLRPLGSQEAETMWWMSEGEDGTSQGREKEAISCLNSIHWGESVPTVDQSNSRPPTLNSETQISPSDNTALILSGEWASPFKEVFVQSLHESGDMVENKPKSSLVFYFSVGKMQNK